MTKRHRLHAVLLVAQCVAAPWVAAQAGDTAWIGEARTVAAALPPKLLSVLRAQIDRGGPEGAIAACRDQAPELARAVSAESGWAVRRVSLRHRNPKAVPDAWERATLEEFDRRVAAREPAAALERAEVVVEDGRPVQRYMRALPTMELCTACHGAPDALSPAVKGRLRELYPDDRATGYAVGDIRGAITLRRPANR